MLLFSFLVQFFGVRVLHSVTVYFQGVVKTFGVNDVLLVAVLFQLFTGVFLAAVYGIWMVPYAHQGQRSLLTFTLPVSKWKFPATYALTLFGLLLLQHFILLISFGINFGFDVFRQSTFPWFGLLVCLGIETLAFETLTFAFAVSSIVLGQVSTLFLGGIAFFLLQMSATLFRFNVGQFMVDKSESIGWAQRIYGKLPPAGELVFDLRTSFLKPSWEAGHWLLWVAWLTIFVLLFRFKIRYPAVTRAGDA